MRHSALFNREVVSSPLGEVMSDRLGLSIASYFSGSLSDVYRASGMGKAETPANYYREWVIDCCSDFSLFILGGRRLPKDESTHLKKTREIAGRGGLNG
jgi:hypothetical protein